MDPALGEIFERAVPATSLEWTGERLTTATSGQVEIEHLHRYFLARVLCRGLDVLDVASGEGYGAALLAQTAKSVVGVEISPDAARHAAASYRVPNLRFLEGDARSLPLPDASVDAVVSFETIEHFYEQEQFLAEIKRVLRPGGRLIVSSPERDVYSPPGSAANPYHARELTKDEFHSLLSGQFTHVTLLAQRPLLGSALVAMQRTQALPLTFERRGATRFEVSSGLPRAAYLVAVASDEEMEVPNSLFVETDTIGEVLSRAATAAALATELNSVQARLQVAETAHATSRAELAQAIEQAKTAHAASRAELAQAIEQADTQARTYAGQLEQAAAQIRTAGEQLEAARQETAGLRAEAETLQLAAAELAQRHHDELARRHDELARHHEDELEQWRGKLQAKQEQIASACTQRDLARLALRRAGAFAETKWRATVQDREQRQETLERQRLEAERSAAEWQARYHALRGHLDLALTRSGLLPAARMMPPPMRRWVRNVVLSKTRP